MATCEVCGNSYDKSFTVIDAGGAEHIFDSIECAAHVLAPLCDHCGCRVLGHGIEADERVFCCGHCARHSGLVDVRSDVSEHATR